MLGLGIKLEIPNFILPKLDILDNQSVGFIISEALRSAGSPAAVAMKALIRSTMANSILSTGAMERAVSIRYGRIKGSKSQFFLMVGMSRNHFELHTNKIPPGVKVKKRKGKSLRGMGLFGQQTRVNKRGVIRSKRVFSTFKDRSKITPKGVIKIIKRKPSKYFHLVDKGFNIYKSGDRFEGYDIIERLRTKMEAEMKRIFEERIQQLLIPAIKRELLRKYRRVFK